MTRNASNPSPVQVWSPKVAVPSNRPTNAARAGAIAAMRWQMAAALLLPGCGKSVYEKSEKSVNGFIEVVMPVW